jgi:NAD(P)H-hydrate epimerase
MEPLLDAESMRETDRWAIEEKGIPSLELMERAGEGLAGVVAEYAPAGRIAIVCGKGNNGGDGLVAARLLRQAGRDVELLLLWKPEWLSADARAMYEKLPGGAVEYEDGYLNRAHVIVDAVLGTGFGGSPRDPVRGVISAMNAAKGRVIAADVPSGVNASTGEVEGEAVHATATATFHRGKPGLWIHPGKAHAGTVHVIDIGIPRGAPAEPAAGLIDPSVMRGYRRRDATSTKFDSGVVVVIGGSRGLAGAPTMTALGAMRAGAGYVTIAAPEKLEVALTARAPMESMYVPLPDRAGALDPEAIDPALKAIAKADAVVLGPGLSKRPAAGEFARMMFERIDTALVVDADGLNALEGTFPEDLPQRRWPTVLTPHAGELARMLGVESEAVNAHRLEHARRAAEESKSIVVLKGDDTLVVAPGGRTAISRGGVPALATAGTGDVLSGVIATMLARGMPAAQAACAAVHVHCRAGQIAAQRLGADGVIASDVIAALPAALLEG